MVIGNLNRQILWAGASVMVAMLLTTTAFAQDTGDAVQIEPVHHGIAVGEPDPNDGVPDIVIDDGAFIPGDPGDLGDDDVDDGDAGDDDWGDDDGPDDVPGDDDGSDPGGSDQGGGDDGIVDDSVDVGTGDDEGQGDDGMVWAGGDPNFCEACGGEIILDGPVEVMQMSSDTMLTIQPAEVAAKPRTSSARPTLTNRVAECLDLHPQIPWLCE